MNVIVINSWVILFFQVGIYCLYSEDVQRWSQSWVMSTFLIWKPNTGQRFVVADTSMQASF